MPRYRRATALLAGAAFCVAGAVGSGVAKSDEPGDGSGPAVGTTTESPAAPAAASDTGPAADAGAEAAAGSAAPPGADASRAAACAEAELQLARLACLLEAAQQADDPTLCLDSGEPPVVFNCLGRFAETAGDPAACDLVPEMAGAPAATLQDACRAGVAVATEDPALCEALEQEGVRTSCLLLLAQRTGDAGLCDRLADEAMRQACRQQE